MNNGNRNNRGSGMNSNMSNTNMKLKYTLYVVLVLVVCYLVIKSLIYVGYYECYQKHDFVNYMLNMFRWNPCRFRYPPQTEREREIKDEREVFHIADQLYTYPQAKCKCSAYNASLASKNQLIDAYNKGAEWNSYGWIEGQQAYYPVQKNCKDQKNKEPHGLVGGYFSNPNIRFGVNCYGIKTKGTMMKEKECPKPSFCEIQTDEKVTHVSEEDNISSFNKTQWSEYV